MTGPSAGDWIVATDFNYPDPVSVTNSSSTITATTTANLPNTVSVSMTNPHPTRGLLVNINLAIGFRIIGSGSIANRCVVTLTSNGPGTGGVAVVSTSSIAATADVRYATSSQGFTTIPPGVTATFTVQARREGTTGTQTIEGPTLSLTPIRYN